MVQRRRHAARAICCVISCAAVMSCSGTGTVADSSELVPTTTQSVVVLGTTSVAPSVNPTAGATTTASEPTSTTTSQAPVVDATLRMIDLRTEPPGARIKLQAAGRTRMVTTPWVGTVRGSTVSIVATADGYEPHRADVDLSDLAGTSATGAPDHIAIPTIWLDPTGQLVDKLIEFDVGSGPKQVAFTPDRSELWVTLLGGSGVDVHDPETGERLAEIELPGGGSVEVIFTNDGSLAYVSQMETASVYEIDVATHRVLRQLRTGSSWTKVVRLSSDERTLYAANWVDDDVTEFDLESGDVIRQIRTVRTPRGLHLSSDDRTLLVAGFDRGELEVVDIESGDREVIHRSGGSARHLVAHPDGSEAYLSDLTRGVVFRVDLATNDVTELARVDKKPNTIDISPDGRVLFVSNRGANNRQSYYLPGPEWGSVVLVDTQTGRHLDAIVGGNQTTGLDVSGDGRRLAYSDFLDDRVAIFAIPTTARLLAGDGGRWVDHRSELAK